jgi:hypothetical protein
MIVALPRPRLRRRDVFPSRPTSQGEVHWVKETVRLTKASPVTEYTGWRPLVEPQFSTDKVASAGDCGFHVWHPISSFRTTRSCPFFFAPRALPGFERAIGSAGTPTYVRIGHAEIMTDRHLTRDEFKTYLLGLALSPGWRNGLSSMSRNATHAVNLGNRWITY